jgi:hypothetical protein
MGALNAFFLGPETAMGFSTRLRLARATFLAVKINKDRV